ncbi:sigma factor [Streptomyces andamanensis]|uniref:Sigma factor n=1 Tax=Streptomyces andamanensis TaxID=1565035 RepID=A0ABV8TAF6_9ACTN
MTETGTGPTRFTTDCATIARILREGDSEPLDAAQETALADALRNVTGDLPRMLSHRAVPDGEDPRDFVQEVLARFVAAATKGLVDPGRSPSGYLLRIASNLMVDGVRSAPDPVPLADLGPVLDSGAALPAAAGTGPDAVARLIDSLGSRAAVREGLARAYRAGDHLVLEVVAAWLDLAAETGAVPGSRAVAERVGVSKTSVANALKRFADRWVGRP